MQNVLVLRQAVLLRVLVTPGASVSCTVTFRALKLYFSYEPNIFLQTLENINNQIQILNDVRPRFFSPLVRYHPGVMWVLLCNKRHRNILVINVVLIL